MATDHLQARPTLNDVAAAAGVSRSTVSLVIRNAGHISAATRERVRQTMKDVGYVYNRGAASMRGGSTRSIGVISPDSANLFMGQFTAAFELEMMKNGFVTLSCHSYEDIEKQNSLITALLERGVDALAIMPVAGSASALTEALRNVDIPLVVAVRPLPDDPFTFVGSDNVVGGHLAAEHLRDHGYASIGYIGGDTRLTLRQDRIDGARAVANSAGIRFDVDIPTDPTGRGGREAMAALIRDGNVPDGLICHNDSVAFGVFRAIRDADPDLLQRVGVIGFDDVVEAELWEPPLTTLSVNAQEVGIAAAQALEHKLLGRDAQASSRLKPRLVVRSSCGMHPSLSEERASR